MHEFFGHPEEVLAKLFGHPTSSDPLSWDGKPYMAIWTHHLTTVIDSLGICKMATFRTGTTHGLAYREFCDSIHAIRGWDMSTEELMETGERIWNLEKMFNIRETGEGRDADKCTRIYLEPNPVEPLRGDKIDPDRYEKALDEYYKIRGWNKDGRPKEETLKRLKLDAEPSHKL